MTEITTTSPPASAAGRSGDQDGRRYAGGGERLKVETGVYSSSTSAPVKLIACDRFAETVDSVSAYDAGGGAAEGAACREYSCGFVA